MAFILSFVTIIIIIIIHHNSMMMVCGDVDEGG